MRWLWLILLALMWKKVLAAPLLCPKCCSQLKVQADTVLREKIKKGMPIELLGIIQRKEKVACHKSLQIRFSLWDQMVIVKSEGLPLAHVPLEEIGPVVCQNMFCLFEGSSDDLAFVLLLNPLWEGRFARLKGQLEGSPGNLSLVNIDWKRVFKDSPAERVLVRTSMSSL